MKPIYITTGEPSGIGTEVSLRALLAWQNASFANDSHWVLVGDEQHIRAVAAKFDLNSALDISNIHVSILHVPANITPQLGQLDTRNAAYVLHTLDVALAACQNGTAAAMVTAPVHKGVINDAKILDKTGQAQYFSGHTEYLAKKSHTPRVVMMLAADDLAGKKPLRIALATTHLPLSAVPAAITPALLRETLQILHSDLRNKFGVANPCIWVTGLNPHAGEGGHMGREEIEVIQPVIDALQAKGINVRGCFPADTIYSRSDFATADAVLCMYHDQGLPVIKYASFGNAVNVTLGLPFIRTSADHGTALDIAAQGIADGGSMLAAMKMAHEMTTKT